MREICRTNALCRLDHQNRLNYIHWIEDLIDGDRGSASDGRINGIDIGTGASCIYPLLGCTLHQDWHFLGTDISLRSLRIAKANLAKNKMADRVRLLWANAGAQEFDESVNSNILPAELLDMIIEKRGRVLPIQEIERGNIIHDFSMCNPPFYSSYEEINVARESKELQPFATCTGSENELITPGGELQFVKTMIEESIILGEKVRWYTSMLGRRETLDEVVAELKRRKIANYVVTEFIQGQRTRRWGIGWSFTDRRPIISPPSSNRMSRVLPPRTFLSQTYPTTLREMERLVRSTLAELNVIGEENVSEERATVEISGTVHKKTWSRQERRKRKRVEESTEPGIEESRGDLVETPLFEFKLKMKEAAPQPEKLSSSRESNTKGSLVNTTLSMTLVAGRDRAVWESLYDHLKKRCEKEFCGRPPP